MKSRFFGSVLLVNGTTIGVGILALPVTSSFGGFFPSMLLFLGAFFLMMFCAFLMVDANLSIKGESNMITMTEKTLGNWAKGLTWVCYLLFLYSITAAYIDTCTPFVVEGLANATGFTLPDWIAPFALPLLFSGFLYLGTSGIDLINRFLMVGLVISFILLVYLLPSHVDVSKLFHADFGASLIVLPLTITAFNYHFFIPSLVTYLGRDRALIRKAIVWGSMLPLVVFVLWQLFVLGILPLENLAAAYSLGQVATVPLANFLNQPFINLFAKFFSFFAITTSFIGAILSLADFFCDGFKVRGSWEGRLLAILLTFFPPLFFVNTYEKGFYLALNYAGAMIAILWVCLPALMVWKLKRYHTPLKRLVLIFVFMIGLGAIASDILEEAGILNRYVSQYTKQEVIK